MRESAKSFSLALRTLYFVLDAFQFTDLGSTAMRRAGQPAGAWNRPLVHTCQHPVDRAVRTDRHWVST
jgi:hypothetical protein